MNDYKIIYEHILKSKNRFPYKYVTIPDFSITINPEDWEPIEDPKSGDYLRAIVEIPTISDVPGNGCLLFKCNNMTNLFNSLMFYVVIQDVAEIEADLIRNDKHYDNIDQCQCIVWGTTPIDRPIILNFTNIIMVIEEI